MTLSDQPLFFDSEAEVSVSTGHLPHWEQIGTVCFITFRTWDSMPREVVERFVMERNGWLRDRAIDPARSHWEQALGRLPREDQIAFRRNCSVRWEESLDGCHGSCPFRTSAHAKIVADGLLHFDGDRYQMFDFVVMPNHVHVLASFPELGAMRKQCASWKHFTATRLNLALGRKGRFWEDESFDHLVRTEPQFWHLRKYIANNPVNAKLNLDQFVHYSRDLNNSPDRIAPLSERADHPIGANT